MPNLRPVEQVDDDRRGSCLRISGQHFRRSRRDTKTMAIGRETNLRGAILEHVWDMSLGRAATSVRWCERDGDE